MFLLYHFLSHTETNSSSVLDFQLGSSWQLPGLQLSLATFLKKSTVVQIVSQAHHQETVCASQGRNKTDQPTSWIFVTARKTNLQSPRTSRLTVTFWVHTSWELCGKHQMIRFSGACTPPAQRKTFASGPVCGLYLFGTEIPDCTKPCHTSESTFSHALYFSLPLHTFPPLPPLRFVLWNSQRIDLKLTSHLVPRQIMPRTSSQSKMNCSNH